ncbi:MAG TPA: aminodeoxychorismate synthase component I [Xanthomonadaceae bacterium]|nr:aminodeoxychorismate synthase component I [Xanthomonadaceae bacterium]
MNPTLRELPASLDLLALHAADPQRYPCLLESAASGTARGRHDVLFAFVRHGFALGADGQTRELDGTPLAGDFLAVLDREFAAGRQAHGAFASHLPFRGGWLLLLGYELATQIEPTLRLPMGEGPLPVAMALRCPAAVLRDRTSGATFALAEAGCEALLDAIAADAAAMAAAPGAQFGPPALRVEEEPPQRFLEGVMRVREYIAAGDVFQVNLSRLWSAQAAGPIDVVGLYARLRSSNPGPFAALLRWGDTALLSSSPERLVAVRGRRVETRPIAGTRPRLSGDDDAGRIRELVGHPKERAEHVMLIDLERNDLGRVCEPGSVVVEEFMAVESYAHVHHIESTVAGVLRADAGPGAVIAAVFPGGTITGCPKVRCMQIIAELEAAPRGAYTGSIGYLNRDGDLDLNILIRTAVTQGSRLCFRAGAGIVADSEPAAELAETRAKARGLLRALGAEG